jgi:spore coat polysaccharide biosynthesis protein SpsF
MRIVAIIQARMNSNRLPGKVLKDICGESMLSRVVHRVNSATSLDKVVVATSDTIVDDLVVNECDKLGVSVFRGSEDDVLDRFFQAALLHKADVGVRVTADCPLIEPIIIDKVVQAFLSSDVDYASNTLNRTYPRGLDVEVISLRALTIAWKNSFNPYHRAHVTPYIYENADLFKLLSVTNSSDWSRYRWTVDTPEDLQFVRRVYEILGGNCFFSWNEVLNLCEGDRSLVELNCHVQQKPLEKS